MANTRFSTFLVASVLALRSAVAVSQPATLLKDLHDEGWGAGSSWPKGFAVLDGKVWFSASGQSGWRVFVSDGTPAGTVALDNVAALGDGQVIGTGFVKAGAQVFFVGVDPATNGRSLWRSDGTGPGTVKVTAAVGPQGPLVVLGTSVLFAGSDPNGVELWVSDGTVEGTHMVKDINPGPASALPGDLAVNGDAVYFRAFDSAGAEPWRSDGTIEGTVRLRDIVPGPGGSFPHDFCALAGAVLFGARDSAGDDELWKTDGTEGGTVRVRDIRPGSVGSNPTRLVRAASRMFFLANDGTTGLELWSSDGTEAGTAIALEILPGGASSGFGSPVTSGDALYVSGATGASDPRISVWRLDSDGHSVSIHGTTTATSALELLVDGARVFAADLAQPATSPGTVFVLEGPGEVSALSAVDKPGEFPPWGAVLNHRVFYRNSGYGGSELWVSDGSAAGTYLFRNLRVGPGSSNPGTGRVVGGAFVFPARFNEPFSATPGRVYRSDGTRDGTEEIWRGGGVNAVQEVRNRGFFLEDRSASGGTAALWTTDGNAAGTYEIAGDVVAYAMLATDTHLFFLRRGSTPSELWKTDGTTAGTEFVTSLNQEWSPEDSRFTSFGSALVFPRYVAGGRTELWIADGLAPGATRLTPAGSSLSGQKIASSRSRLYFVVAEPSGDRVWSSNGTTNGTQPIAVQPIGFSPGWIEQAGRLAGDALAYVSGNPSLLRFADAAIPVATDAFGVAATSGEAASNIALYARPTHYAGVSELWRTDLSAEGTYPLAVPVWSRTFSTFGSHVLFVGAAENGFMGEPWISDGSPQGTRRLQSIGPPGNPSWATVIGRLADTVFLAADDRVAGREPWVFPVARIAAEKPSRFHPVTPCRLVDTRLTPVGPLGGPIPGGARRTFEAGGSCGLSRTARSNSANVTVVGPAAAGTLRIQAADDPATETSALAFAVGKTRANNALIGVSRDRAAAFTVRNDSPAPVHVIIDVNGYFE